MQFSKRIIIVIIFIFVLFFLISCDNSNSLQFYDVNIEIEGNGAVIKDPDDNKYEPGTTVRLEAVPGTDSYFDHWAGDISGQNNPISIPVDSNKEILAHFNSNDFVTVSVSGQVNINNNTGYTGHSSTPDSFTKTSSDTNIQQLHKLKQDLSPMTAVDHATVGTISNDSDNYKKGEIIVKYKPMISTQTKSNLEREHELNHINKISINDGKIVRYQISGNKSVSQMLSYFKKQPQVEWAEPNYICYPTAIPNDSDYSYQWGHVHANLEAAWDITQSGSTVRVAVIDTGVLPNHPDLQGNLSEAGADFVGGDNSKPVEDYNYTDQDPTDPTTQAMGGSHGTHVAGIIGAVTNNNKGVAGVGRNIEILPIRSLSSNNGYYFDIAEGIYYAIDQNVDIINMSIGGGSRNTLQEAVEAAATAGIVVVASAGNNGESGVLYPGGYDSVISVGAVNYNNELTDYSNYGSELDLVAPGGENYGIYSTWGYYENDSSVTDYTGLAGTSMAAPYVSGIAALLKANGVSTVNNIKNRLFNSAVDLGSEGKDNQFGYGLVDAYAALLGDQPLTRPTVFMGQFIDGKLKIMSEKTQINRNDTFVLNQSEPGDLLLFGWRDVNQNQIIDQGDYYGVSGSTYNINEGSNISNLDLDLYYVSDSFEINLK